MTRKSLYAAALLAVSAMAYAQEQPRPAFAVASVRPSAADGTTGSVRPGPGRLTAQGASIFLLLRIAYNLPDYQIAGPAWIKNERYDIVATAGEPVGEDVLRRMLQTLLAERFKLVTRREQQMRSAYVLVVADDGPRLKKAAGTGGSGAVADGGRWSFTGTSTAGLVRRLSEFLNAPVVDQTGLAGSYDFTLEWQQDENLPGASIFTAVREQLGLRLESRRLPLEILVVDHAERVPTEN